MLVAAGVHGRSAARCSTLMRPQRALAAFRLSCPALMRRQDQSGLTQPADWTALCAEAAIARRRATRRASSATASTGCGSATARPSRPAITSRRSRARGRRSPATCRSTACRPTSSAAPRPDGTTGRGRIDETGTCVLYFTRAEIEDGALAGKGLELAWAADPVDLFFLEIQGSGRIRLPDGSVMRIGYADQNGRDYVAIGRLLRDRGILPPGGANMQAIKDWIRANPDQGRALMRENLSYIFFKELTGPGPLGALNVPVTPHGTVAADPNFVPLGAPVFLDDATAPEVDGLWVAQDTGGAIKGPNRFDTFWGAGPRRRRSPAACRRSGEALILLPKGVAARALAQP